MSTARVHSIDAIKEFRLALCGFADKAGLVLNDADCELQRTLNWLETEQYSYWEGQIRKRNEDVAKAKQAVLVKKLCRNIDGSPGSAVEEEKALRIAIRKLEEAKQKLAGVRRYAHVLQKEILNYRGQVQRLANNVAVDIPLALGRLDFCIRKLEDYVAAGGAAEPEAVSSTAVEDLGGSPEQRPSMARPEPVEPEQTSPEDSIELRGSADQE
ncbi:MAG TPA: hypothetical protein VLM89_14380 [Phycisphaerae bacterium]|nr:hypothetical protein [Phycisphaerae bacterium]